MSGPYLELGGGGGGGWQLISMCPLSPKAEALGIDRFCIFKCF